MADGGYAWWYLDALSDDGEHALTLIAFVGSVFSPYYAKARRGPGAAAADDHCAFNLALYRRAGGGHWAMTEFPAARCTRTADELVLGGSRLAWQGAALQVDVDERTAPRRQRLRGALRVQPQALVDRSHALDAAGRHHWRPIAPCARIEVDLHHPALRWQGTAYLDSNLGSRGLERDFVRWDWLRAALPDGRTAVLYDGQRRDGSPFALAEAYATDGRVLPFEAPPPASLRRSAWGVARAARCEAGAQARTVQTLEDGPFYARGLLATRLAGHDVTAVHESLSLDRFGARWVQALLPFRMRRRGAWPWFV